MLVSAVVMFRSSIRGAAASVIASRRDEFWHVDIQTYFGNPQTMKEGPDISIVAALIGNPACANMLTALLPGPALTATELAQEAGLTASTVSGYLTRLEGAGLVAIERQGRHRYYRLAQPAVGPPLAALKPGAAP